MLDRILAAVDNSTGGASALRLAIELAHEIEAKPSLYPDAELVAGSKVHAILRCAKQYRADLIVMGMKNRAIVADRTTQNVAEWSPCAVLGVP